MIEETRRFLTPGGSERLGGALGCRCTGIEYRARGGINSDESMLVLCWSHQLEASTMAWRLSASAPLGVIWRLGTAAHDPVKIRSE